MDITSVHIVNNVFEATQPIYTGPSARIMSQCMPIGTELLRLRE
jgi:hypothetical protein